MKIPEMNEQQLSNLIKVNTMFVMFLGIIAAIIITMGLYIQSSTLFVVGIILGIMNAFECRVVMHNKQVIGRMKMVKLAQEALSFIEQFEQKRTPPAG